MVPWLHQCIFNIKRKLPEWRTQKCNLWFGAKSQLRSTGLQNARFHAAQYRANSADLPKFGAFLTLVPWLHQCILYIKRKLRVLRTQKRNPWFGAKSPLRSTGLQNTLFHSAPYSADSADFPKIGASFNHGTVIAPIHSLYQKEATEMENPKI